MCFKQVSMHISSHLLLLRFICLIIKHSQPFSFRFCLFIFDSCSFVFCFLSFFLSVSLPLSCLRPLSKTFNGCSFVIFYLKEEKNKKKKKKHVSCLVLLYTTQLFEHFILVSFLYANTHDESASLSLIVVCLSVCAHIYLHPSGVSIPHTIQMFFFKWIYLINPF